MNDKLYHVTWECNVDSILKLGLVPNHTPNGWVMSGAKARRVGKTFLCTLKRAEYWRMTMYDGWAEPPIPDPKMKIVFIEVDASGIDLTADEEVNEYYEGDFWTDQRIPPDRLELVKE